jgi:iron complex outermembrane receptor protein
MTAFRRLPLALLLLATSATSALAQATANPVTNADDAFGFTIGDESVGIYDASSVRGFDLEAAGNYRVNGGYFVKSSGVSSFFVDTTTVRIGLNTLNVDLPGPSGVVDFKLRDPAAGEPSYVTTGLDEYEQPYMDLLLKHRSEDGRFSGALGLGLVFDKKDAQGGEDGQSWLLGGTARATLGPVTARVFGGDYDYERAGTFRFTLDDPNERPRLKRGRYLGQDWARSKGQRRIAGLLLDAPLGASWTVGATGVFSQEDPTRAVSQLFLGLDEALQARSLIIASPQQRATAWSGEARLSWTGETGAARHRVTFLARGRRSRSSFGGDQVLDQGQVGLDRPVAALARPDLSGARANLRDETDQWGLGASYRMSWANRLTVNAGVLRTDYEKTFIAADGLARSRSAAPILYNLGGAARITRSLDLYGSYSRGLEEAGAAPSSAANRNEVLNAIRVTQREVGARYAVSDGMTLVVAAFQTEKPYAGLDATTNIFRTLGSVRHRGVEASLSGRLSEALTVVVGGVWLDPTLSGDEVESGAIGRRPLGVARLRGVANVNYTVSAVPGLSLDAGLEYVGARPFRAAVGPDGRQPRLSADWEANFGLRYRLDVGGWRPTLRAQVLNAFGSYGLSVNGAETLDYSAPRRFRVLLTTEF